MMLEQREDRKFLPLTAWWNIAQGFQKYYKKAYVWRWFRNLFLQASINILVL